jgi:RHS repeat-associated protein
VGYSAVGRIVSFNATGNTAGFGYDANGNRSSSTRALNGTSTNRTYTVGSASNQLTGFTQTINGASSTSVTYGYNANGDLLTDGLRSYAYDAEGRLAAATTGATDVSPTTRYAHNALGQRVFKTEPLYPPSQGDEADPGFMQSLIAFFTKLWSPATTTAEQLGYAYVYDEQGTLIAEVGSGGTNSAGQSQYIYLPTANGPMPIAAVINGSTYAIHSDHLNTPRKLTNADGQAVWQWGYSAFGEDKHTIAKNRFANLDTTPNPGTTSISEVKFDLRYPGQYADEESGLSYNYFRSYDARTGRYSQPDPIGLDGGWNRFGYVDGNPLKDVDPTGLLMFTVGGNVRLPIVGGATHSIGISYLNGQWDAGIIVNADIPLLSVGKLLGRATVDVGLQSGDFCTNDKSYQENFQVGYKALGGSLQRDENGVSGVGISVGPQIGVSVSGQSSSTLSIRKDLLPFISRLLNR